MKVEVAVLGPPSRIVLMVFVDVKQHRAQLAEKEPVNRISFRTINPSQQSLVPITLPVPAVITTLCVHCQSDGPIILYMTSKSESTKLDKSFVFRQKRYLVISVLKIKIKNKRRRRRRRRKELLIVTNGTEPLYISSHQALESVFLDWLIRKHCDQYLILCILSRVSCLVSSGLLTSREWQNNVRLMIKTEPYHGCSECSEITKHHE